MSSPLRQQSFVGGEMAPERQGRTHDPRYSVSLRTCKNFLPIVNGALVNRAGTYDLGGLASTDVRYEVFVFSDDQAFVLEFTPGQVRFWTAAGLVLNAGVPYVVATPYLAADLPLLKFAQAGDVVTISRRGYQSRELTRIANTNWTLTLVSTTPQAYFAGAPSVGGQPNGQIGPNAAVAANVYDPVVTYAGNDLVLYQPGGGINPVKMYVSNFGANLNNQPDTHPAQWSDITFSAAVSYKKGSYAWQALNDKDGQVYISLFDNNKGNTPAAASTFWAVATDTARVPKEWQFVITQSWRDSNGVLLETLGSTPTQSGLKIAAYTDRPVFIGWGVESGGPAAYTITGYNLYAGRNGVFGFIGDAPAGTHIFFWDGGAPDFGIQPPRGTNPFAIAGAADSYPGAVTFHDQRRVFAGTDKKPSTFFGSATTDISRFDVNDPPQDGDSYEWRVSSRKLENIRSVVSFGRLLLFTSQGVFSAHGADGTGITPNAVEVRRQLGAAGASLLDPVETGTELIYATSKGNYVRDLYFDFTAGAYVGNDLTQHARHLFKGYTITSWAYQETPDHVLWVVRSDGRLFSCTYNRPSGTVAWAQHPTLGQVLQVGCLPNGTEDALMLGVIRNGSPRMERMASRTLPQIADGIDAETGLTKYRDDVRPACFLDAAKAFDGRNTGVTTMNVSGASYNADDVVTVDASVASFALTDVNDQIVIDPDGTPTRITVTQFNSATQVLGRIEAPLPAQFQNVPTLSWGFARDTLTGLAHLNGMSVMVLADGVVQGPFTVDGGQIGAGADGPLNPPALIATTGLSYNSDAELLDIAADAAKPNVKSVVKVTLEVVASRGLYAGEDFDHLRPWKQRRVSDNFEPAPLETGEAEVSTSSGWNKGGRACVRQADPLPLMIVAATRELEVGGR